MEKKLSTLDNITCKTSTQNNQTCCGIKCFNHRNTTIRKTIGNIQTTELPYHQYVGLINVRITVILVHIHIKFHCPCTQHGNYIIFTFESLNNKTFTYVLAQWASTLLVTRWAWTAQAQWMDVQLRQPLMISECPPGHVWNAGHESDKAWTAGGVRAVHSLMFKFLSPSSSYLFLTDFHTPRLFFTDCEPEHRLAIVEAKRLQTKAIVCQTNYTRICKDIPK